MTDADACAAAFVGDVCYFGDGRGNVRATSSDERVIACGGSAASVRCIQPAHLLPGGADGIVVGDAAGVVAFFQGGRRVCAHTLPLPVAALARHTDADDMPAVIAADEGGTMICFGLMSTQPIWRLRLKDMSSLAHVCSLHRIVFH